MNRSEATTAPRALLYVATEAGGAACWVDDIRTIEDDVGGGCTIWIRSDFADENIAIETPWSTWQVIDALRDIQNRLPGALCVPEATEQALQATEPPWIPGPPITVTVHDTVTGVRATDSGHDWDWWTSGGGSYDHFRESLFRSARAVSSYETQKKRFLIIAIRDTNHPSMTRGEALFTLNRGYPPDLLARFDIPAVQP